MNSPGDRMQPIPLSGTPPLTGPDPEQKRRGILDCFHATFDRYEQLFEVLSCDEACCRKRFRCATC